MALCPIPPGWTARFTDPNAAPGSPDLYADAVAVDDTTGRPWVILPGGNRARDAQELAQARGLVYKGIDRRVPGTVALTQPATGPLSDDTAQRSTP